METEKRNVDGSLNGKRIFDLLAALGGLVALSPLLGVIAAAVKWEDSGPVFYRQRRIGQFGKSFWLWKFRTMVQGADNKGPLVTQRHDGRVTKVGRILRKYKLDELPQLWNVACGDMSLVGPRPEVAKYVNGYSAQQREVLRLKPGITDLASICFRNEEDLLAGAEDPEELYLRKCLPEKLELNFAYARQANLWRDVVIIAVTLFPSLSSVTFIERRWKQWRNARVNASNRRFRGG